MTSPAVAATPLGPFGGPDETTYRRWVENLADVIIAVHNGATEREVGDLIAKSCVDLSEVDRAAVLVADEDRECLSLVGAAGLTTDYIEDINGENPIYILDEDDPRGRGPSSRVFRSGRTVVVRDVSADPTFGPWLEIATKEGFQSLLAVPLKGSTGTLGVLTCYCDRPDPVGRAQIELIELLGHSAALALESFQLRGQQATAIADLQSALQRVNRDRVLHRSLTTLVLDGGSIDDVVESVSDFLGDTVSFVTARSDDPNGVAVRIAADTIGMLLPTRTLDEDERRALESAGLVVALEHQRHISIEEAEARHGQDLLGEIIPNDAIIDPDGFMERARRLGFCLDMPHTIVLLRADEPVLRSSRRLASMARRLAPAGNPPPLASYRNDIAVVLVPRTEAYRDFPRLLHSSAQRELGTVGCSTMVGATCEQITDYSSAFSVARAALDLRQRSGVIASSACVENLGTLQFLLQSPPDDLLRFTRTLLGPLEDPVGRGPEPLLPTLRAYLENRLNTTATAKKLQVHPNTVNNRLERIGKLTGAPIHDTDHLLDLRLAVLVQDVLDT